MIYYIPLLLLLLGGIFFGLWTLLKNFAARYFATHIEEDKRNEKSIQKAHSETFYIMAILLYPLLVMGWIFCAIVGRDFNENLIDWTKEWFGGK